MVVPGTWGCADRPVGMLSRWAGLCIPRKVPWSRVLVDCEGTQMVNSDHGQVGPVCLSSALPRSPFGETAGGRRSVWEHCTGTVAFCQG